MVVGPARGGDFQWVYAVLGLCFVILAALRLQGGSVLWAAVFGLAALGYAYLSVRFVLPPGLGGVRQRGAGQRDPVSASPGRAPEELQRTLGVYESRARGWLAIAAAGCVITAAVMLLTPSLALVAAALSLFSAYRVRRCRRSVRILRRALAVVPDKTQDTGGGAAR